MKKVKRCVLFFLSLGSNLDSGNYVGQEFTYKQLYAMVPFAFVSIRGAIAGLKEEKLVMTFIRGGQIYVRLTSQGRERLKAEFMGLQTVDEKRNEERFTVCMFIEKNEVDPAFRLTRDYLMKDGFIQLGRGMYFLPSRISESTKLYLAKSHIASHLMVCDMRRLVIGDISEIIQSKYPIARYVKQANLLENMLRKAGEKCAENKRLQKQSYQFVITALMAAMDFFAQDLVLVEKYFSKDVRCYEIKQMLYRTGISFLPHILTQ